MKGEFSHERILFTFRPDDCWAVARGGSLLSLPFPWKWRETPPAGFLTADPKFKLRSRVSVNSRTLKKTKTMKIGLKYCENKGVINLGKTHWSRQEVEPFALSCLLRAKGVHKAVNLSWRLHMAVKLVRSMTLRGKGLWHLEDLGSSFKHPCKQHRQTEWTVSLKE